MRRAGDNKIEQSSCTHISLVQKKRSVQIFNSVFRVPCMKNLVTAEQWPIFRQLKLRKGPKSRTLWLRGYFVAAANAVSRFFIQGTF